MRGPWKWTGDVWRRVDPTYEGADFPNNPLSWFDRRTVQQKLDFNSFIDCGEKAPDDAPLPDLAGLQVGTYTRGVH